MLVTYAGWRASDGVSPLIAEMGLTKERGYPEGDYSPQIG